VIDAALRSLVVLGLCFLGACRSVDRPLPVPPEPPATDPHGPASAESARFEGIWGTSFGTMRLHQDGDRVWGIYLYGGSATLEGQLGGRLLRATYSEPSGRIGQAVLELSQDGASFSGRWREGLEPPLELDDRRAGRWRGRRLVPVDGRTWLVILEAHWEESLGEHEYSYGDMLRGFFERVPAVEVRHRYFHDRADLVRFCQELQGLVEPVVLYVSTHGSSDGVQVGGETIDGATIGSALREAGALRLVHFGSCEVLRGAEPGKLLAAAEPHEPFPISGFRAVADWAGSAIVDFTYLSLVLEQGMEPADAVRATRDMVTFAGPPARDGSPIAGSDLVLWGESE